MGDNELVPNLQDISNTTLLGTLFGIGLVIMLSWVDELGESRQFSFGRIILKTLIGAILSSLVFLGSFYLTFSDTISNVYVGSALTWVLFGLVIGLVLSFQSSISVGKGILGGTLAGILAFLIYNGITFLFPTFPNFAKLFSLMAMGAVLGFTLVTVVKSLEDFEIEFIAPAAYRRIIPISKWLRNNVKIDIGTEQGAYVMIKWSDTEVQPLHANLVLSNGDCIHYSFCRDFTREAFNPY